MLEAAVLILLVVVAMVRGYDILSAWHGPGGSLTTELYIPAASMASGRGFANIIPESVPGFRQFLDFQQSSLSPDLLKKEGKEQPLHQYQQYHRYLITAVGWVWSLFGLSWESMKILILFLFAVCLWEVYGISRLAMGVVASLAVTLGFAWADTVSTALAPLRDFSKAPFILGAILLLGWAIRKPRRWGWTILVALATGTVLGIGLGFRRDTMVIVPFAVLVFLLAPVQAENRLRRHAARLAAVALLACAFCASGWPILRAFYERGTLAEHDTMMGFSTNADREMSLQPSSFEKLYVLNDLYCSMQAHDAGRRNLTMPSGDYQKHCTETAYDAVLKGNYVLAVLTRFPADMLSRSYAATLRILGGIQGPAMEGTGPSAGQSTPAKFVRRSADLLSEAVAHGAWFALIALICVSAVNARLATLTLLFVLFFGGYTSGQFSGRHVFHLAFVPLFFGAFMVDGILRTSFRVLCGRLSLGGGRTGLKALGRMGVRAAVWAACAITLLYLPWRVALLAQKSQVDQIVDKITLAENVPVGCRESAWDDRVLLTPEVSDDCSGCQNEGLLVNFKTTYYEAVFAAGPDVPEVDICYEADDFSYPATIALGPGGPCDVSYYFPVFEPTQCSGWIRFAGLAVPKEQAGRFKGFLRIRHPEEMDLPINIAVPASPERLLYYQRTVWPWHGGVRPQFGRDGNKWETLQMQAKAGECGAQGKWADALNLWESLAQRRPVSRMAGIGRAEALDHLERYADALDVLAALLKLHPEEGLVCRLVDESLGRSRGSEGKVAAWRALTDRVPEDQCVRRYADKAAVPPVSSAR